MRSILKAGRRVLAAFVLIALLASSLCVFPASAERMHISDRGVKLIVKYEGFHTYKYWDHQQWTIGYGTACGANEYPNGITREEAERELKEELVKTENLLYDFLDKYNLKLNQNQFDALVSFGYNVGQYIWFTSDNFTLRNYILDGIQNHSKADFEYAFGLWCKAGGQVLEGLVRRRADEAALFNTPVATYTVTYNANGGENAPAKQTKEDGDAITLSTAKPTREGYEFIGWATDAKSTDVRYSGGEVYSAKANLSLYAVWAKDNVIKYNANGGEGAPEAQTKHPSQTLKLSTAKPARLGYTFMGWSTDKNAATATYTSGGKYAGAEDLTLYAVWSEMSVVCFDAFTHQFGELSYRFGDVDHDGQVTAADADLLALYLATGAQFDDADRKICDVDLSGQVDGYDVWLVEKLVNGAIPNLPAKAYNVGASYSTLPKVSFSGMYFIGWTGVRNGDTAINTNATVASGVSVLYPVFSDKPLSGDVNFDGSVNVADVMGLKNLIMQDGEVEDDVMLAADADANGVLDVGDIMKMVSTILS